MRKFKLSYGRREMIKSSEREFWGDAVMRGQAGNHGSDGASPYPELRPLLVPYLPGIRLVPLVPTHCRAEQFRGPRNAQFFADVAAMHLHRLDADAERIGDLPGGIAKA
jgi:hypothetical protein